MALRPCIVSFKDMRGIRHATEVEAESLFEAAVLGIRRLNEDPWLEKVVTCLAISGPLKA